MVDAGLLPTTPHVHHPLVGRLVVFFPLVWRNIPERQNQGRKRKKHQIEKVLQSFIGNTLNASLSTTTGSTLLERSAFPFNIQHWDEVEGNIDGFQHKLWQHNFCPAPTHTWKHSRLRLSSWRRVWKPHSLRCDTSPSAQLQQSMAHQMYPVTNCAVFHFGFFFFLKSQ